MKVQGKFKCPIYPIEVKVLYHPEKEEVSKYFNIGKDMSSTNAMVMLMEDNRMYLVWYKKDIDLGVLLHETIHIVNFVFDIVGIKLDSGNDEHQAYYTQFIFESLHKLLIKAEAKNLTKN